MVLRLLSAHLRNSASIQSSSERGIFICRKSVQAKTAFETTFALKHNQISRMSSPGIVEVLGPWPVPVAAVVRDPTAGARIKSMSPSFSKQNSRMYINT